MSALEAYGAQAMVCMNRMYDKTGDVRVKCGRINGPAPALTGKEPYAMVTVSCPFTARSLGDPIGGDNGSVVRIKASEIQLTNPQP